MDHGTGSRSQIRGRARDRSFRIVGSTVPSRVPTGALTVAELTRSGLTSPYPALQLLDLGVHDPLRELLIISRSRSEPADASAYYLQPLFQIRQSVTWGLLALIRL